MRIRIHYIHQNETVPRRGSAARRIGSLLLNAAQLCPERTANGQPIQFPVAPASNSFFIESPLQRKMAPARLAQLSASVRDNYGAAEMSFSLSGLRTA